MKTAFLLLLPAFLFSSCSKDGDATNVSTHHYNATIRVTVKRMMVVNGHSVDSLLAGATVQVYESKDDRDLALTPDYGTSTGFDGIATFYNLDTSYYYLRVINPYNQSVINDETNTPDGTISQLEEIFQ